MSKEAYSIIEFCAAHGISRSTFYALLRAGRGPRLMRMSANRVAISREAAEEWRRAREADAEAERRR
jgi:predicted DNA-binding transcriptional regulator AlpA